MQRRTRRPQVSSGGRSLAWLAAVAPWSCAATAPAAAQDDQVRLPTCGDVSCGGEVAPVRWSAGCTGAASAGAGTAGGRVTRLVSYTDGCE